VLARANLWEDLRRSLDTGRKKQFCQHMSNGDDDAAALVSNLAMGYPELVPHSRHVTDLALMLFDALKPLHHLGEHERFLLWCAGQLHDIGWKFGQARHNRHGAEMVYTDEILPFDLTERGIIAGAICLHRGKLRLSTCPYIDLLSPENQQNALMIAAILRIADGLDYPKNGSVRGIRCTLSAGEVTCTVTGTEDLTLEKERALRRSDLFQQVFNRPLVIS
jgi:exopolyphosphatase/guanosine-5'-triphosphate,3'-diphosphate pyrophosphatase